LKILVVHNRYQQAGGEDSVFVNEVALLRSGGHEVATLVDSNDAIAGRRATLAAGIGTIWNLPGQRRMAEAIARTRPDMVHVHNFLPRFSPAVFWTCAQADVPSVLTLHNFRLGCANGLLFRDGHVCEECIPGSPLPAIRHRCYRGSMAGSAAIAGMIATHRAIGTWRNKVSRFIALNGFARDRFIDAGLPPDRISVKPNFVDVPAWAETPRSGALFVGRLSVEKGVDVLLKAWRSLDIPITIIGDGPERERLERQAPRTVSFLGKRTEAEVQAAMASAELLIVPSIWFENFPMTVVEAMAQGTPVLASRLGAMIEIVEQGVTGWHFAAADPQDLATQVRDLFARPDRLRTLGRTARRFYETELSASVNLSMLERIYDQARRGNAA
jgi:glycosyltransferase involved in cell wall biosynthesis